MLSVPVGVYQGLDFWQHFVLVDEIAFAFALQTKSVLLTNAICYTCPITTYLSIHESVRLFGRGDEHIAGT